MECGLKWVHMARYEFIFKLVGTLWLTIISGPLLTPKRAMKISKINKKSKKSSRAGQVLSHRIQGSNSWQGAFAATLSTSSHFRLAA